MFLNNTTALRNNSVNFNRQLLGNNILAFNFRIDLIDFILISMSYVDVYTEAVVISMFKEWHVMYN